MDNPKQAIVDRIKQANNILVMVSKNPSVDQLSAAIGFTLLLNKLGKHGTAVFSGEVPSVLEFLEPERTIEKTTDSLRDFIIALDKAKADKLRYKVEENHVKIFITPYHTSISEKDLDFSQGDFNVDVVVALSVLDPNDLDEAISSHGRILHDATVITVSSQGASTLGSLNWTDAGASSIGEMLVMLAEDLGQNLIDDQIATAFLTGIVAETDRFSNAKTSATTMSISSKLMSAGANQQLVATKLEEPEPAPEEPAKPEPEEADKKDKPADDKKAEHPKAPKEEAKPEPPAEGEAGADGSLQISHNENKNSESAFVGEEELEGPKLDQINIDDQGTLHRENDILKQPIVEPAAATEAAEPKAEAAATEPETPSLILKPPALGGTLTANAQVLAAEPSTDPLSAGPDGRPLLNHEPSASPPTAPVIELPEPVTAPEPSEIPLVAAPPEEAQKVEESLANLEKTVQDPDQPAAPTATVSDARDAVIGALDADHMPSLDPLPMPTDAAPQVSVDMNPDGNVVAPDSIAAPAPTEEPLVAPSAEPIMPPLPNLALPPENTLPTMPPADAALGSVTDTTAPPPVPPPFPMPPLPNPDGTQAPADQQPPQAA